ncbi:DUF5011 domain-containing protein [Carnobacterium maltaromaticum]|uniref:DUF5011 domain-containing protein n=1 Tax=Carnobacterium maltaromaticum TaxID=2751 RepID=UPI001071E5CB|nr:DUF5011 domain-containing protein [Carnobacterium maltaromaticum]TFJ70067.1 DUF5011 domain-containing protein [Carnobacterium maltaromaticum]TFJ75986.1 DUF5011 domain-containing protein [Carnobacterium maltaromaticum]
MNKKMKFIGMSAAVLLAISPVVTPILGVSSAVVYADSSYDAILRNALKASVKANGWNNRVDPADTPVVDKNLKQGLMELVNSGAKNTIYTGEETNVFFTQIFTKVIAKEKTLKEILGAAGANSEAQFLVNGKSDVTMEDLSSSVLTITVKVFGTDGKTAEADITLNTDAPEIAIKEGIVVTAELSDAYLDFTVNPSRFVEVISGDSSASGWTISDAVSSPDMATVSPSKAGLGPNGEGVIDADGFYVKAGPYTQLVTITLTNSADDTLREKRTISITVNVGDDEADFLFLEKPLGNNNSFPSGSTALNATISGIDNRQDLAGKRFSDILIQNNPDYFNYDSKITNRTQLDADLKTRFIDLFMIDAEGPAESLEENQLGKLRLSVDSSNIDFSKGNSMALVPFTYVTEFGKTMTVTLELLIKQPNYPIIEFNTNQDMTINVGTPFNLYDFKAYQDSATNLLTNRVSISGIVNTSKVGTYELTYSVANKYNLKTTLIRTINVVDLNGSPNNKPTITSLETVGYVKYVAGYGIRVWSTPDGNGSNQYLPHGTAWKIDQKATFKDGSIWYRVGKDQWVDGSYIKFTPVSSPGMKELKGVGTINYVQGYSVNVYRGAEASGENWTGNQLKHGTKWRVYGEKDGFYNLGGDQWVSTKYISFQKD